MSKQQRYFVTGGAGFIGSHLVENLLARGAAVAVLDDLSSGRLENLAGVADHPSLQIHVGGLDDEERLDALTGAADTVVHLAAAVGVERVVREPLRTMESNLFGFERVLDAAARHSRRVLVASSSEVYGKGGKSPFSEDDDVVLGATTKGRWSYAATKMVGEFLTLAHRRQSGLEGVVCRFFNTIGPRQSDQYGMVAPRFVRQALAGKPLTVYGDGSQSRCFCDVRDVVEAVALLAETPEAAGLVVNVGSDREISILELAEMVLRLTGSGSTIERVPYEDAYEPGFEDIVRRVPDTARIRNLIGWQPRRTLEQTLQAIIADERRKMKLPSPAREGAWAAAGD
ncbi:MAG: NAD-dependent epimerase/dehydratase family protein [Acidobacteria bacterium]|nr:NAD-dependent epimerase/dehydratase family protein [Acidobacteriota bacterium]